MKSEACKLIRAEKLQAVCARMGVIWGDCECFVHGWYALYLSPVRIHTECAHQAQDLRWIVRGSDAGMLGSSEQESRSYVGDDVLCFFLHVCV